MNELRDRFLSRLVVEDSGCWSWAKYICQKGYGIMTFKGEKYKAHRVSLFLFKGIPLRTDQKLICADHLCRNRSCVNPDHLEVVSDKENILRGNGICAKNKRKDMCKNGHEFTSENTYQRDKGRECKTCKKNINLKIASRKRETQGVPA